MIESLGLRPITAKSAHQLMPLRLVLELGITKLHYDQLIAGTQVAELLNLEVWHLRMNGARDTDLQALSERFDTLEADDDQLAEVLGTSHANSIYIFYHIFSVC